MLKNMKIGKRLIAAFLVAIILSSTAGIVGIALLTKSDNDYSAVLDNYGFAQGELGNLGRHFQASRVLNLYVITAANQTDRGKYIQDLAAEDAKIDQDMTLVKARLSSDLGREVYATLDTAMKEFRSTRDAVIQDTSSSVDVNANIALYRAQLTPKSDEVRSILDTMIADKSRIRTEKSVGLSTQMVIFRWVMISVIVVALLCAVALAIIIARGISAPLVKIELAASKMAQGDYDTVIDYVSKDEVGSLAESMRQMTSTTKAILLDTVRGLNEIANGNFDIQAQTEYIGIFYGIKTAMIKIIGDLSETMSQITMAAEQVSTGSEQVSSGAQALAQGATEQASSVEELSAAINEVSQQIRDNAVNATSANTAAVSVGGNVRTSNTQMGEMMGAMTEISSSSSQISKIIKTIEDIAFQTNILALNAAVEAARAGAAGKGFAVVADEVRNLATKSSEAAKQTNVLIEGSVRSVENGVKIADATAKSLAEVVTGVKEITTLIEKISTASDEQSISIAQINLGVEQISSVVQTNSATSEESAAASEELNGQAIMMKQMVGKFRLSSSVTGEPAYTAIPEQSYSPYAGGFSDGQKY